MAEETSGQSPTFLLHGTAPPLKPMALSLDQIRAAADRVAASFGMEVVDLEFSGNPKARILRVFLEKVEAERQRLIAASAETGADPLPSGVAAESLSGVTHDDCSRFSEDFSVLLDVEDLVPGAEYTLEVSSPGLDRKLHGEPDFHRFRGSLVKLQTREPLHNNRQWRGRIVEATAGVVRLDLSAVRQKSRGKGKKEIVAELVEIPFSSIEKANLLPEL